MKYAILTVTVFLSILPALCGGQEEQWRLVATEIDSETLSANSTIIWSQAYARVREITTYIDPSTGDLHVLFNGGGSTSVYDHNKSNGSLKILVDGSAASKRSLGRMVALPAKDKLLVIDVSHFELLVFTLSTGEFITSIDLFDDINHAAPSGMTFIVPSQDADAIVWNEQSDCIFKVTLNATMTAVMCSREWISGLVDIIEQPASVFHLLHRDCTIRVVQTINDTGVRASFKADLDQKTRVSASVCNQMTLHQSSLSYLVTSPTSDSVSVINTTTGALVGVVMGPSNSEPYSIASSSWNEDLILIGAGISVYGASAKRLAGAAKSFRKKDTAQLVWTDILPPSDYPVPDLSRIQQQPDAFGGGFYIIGADKGFLLGLYESKYRVVRVDFMDSIFEALDALAYFPSQRCPQRAIGVTESMVKTYISGITGELDASVLMEYTGGGVPQDGELLFKSSGPTQRITSIDHHPFYPLIAAGTSDGHVFFIDTNTKRVLKDHAYIARYYVSSVSWLCSTSSSPELYVSDKNHGLVMRYNFTYQGSSQEPKVELLDSYGPLHNPRNLVQNPTTGDFYVICDDRRGAGFEAYIIKNKTLVVENLFTFRFSNLVFQKIGGVTPTTSMPIPRPTTGATLDQALFTVVSTPKVLPERPPEENTTLPPASSPDQGPVDNTESSVNDDDLREGISHASPPTAQYPATQNKAAQKNSDSIKTPMTVFLALVASAVVIALVVVAVRRVQDRQYRKDWEAKRSKVQPSTEGELARWAIAQHFNDRTSSKSSGPKGALQLKDGLILGGDDVDDEQQRAAAMSRMPEDSPTEKISRMLKFAGVGVQSLVSRVMPPRGETRPFFSMVDPAPDPYSSSIEIGYSPAAGEPKHLKVYQVNTRNEHGVTFIRQTSSGAASPVVAATPPRQHSPRRVASMQVAATNYSSAAERVASAWPDGATVVVNPKTNKLEEEIDLTTSEDEDLVMKRAKTSEQESAGQDRSIGERLRGAFKGLFEVMPFRASSEQKHK